MNVLRDRKLDPSAVSPEILKELDDLMGRGKAVLVGPNGERIDLPDALNDLLLFVVESMKRKQAVFLLPQDEELTTQAAANLLGISRPYLLRLLQSNTIPFHRVGTHRRIALRDLITYQTTRAQLRREALSGLTKAMEAEGVYDRKLEPKA